MRSDKIGSLSMQRPVPKEKRLALSSQRTATGKSNPEPKKIVSRKDAKAAKEGRIPSRRTRIAKRSSGAGSSEPLGAHNPSMILGDLCALAKGIFSDQG